MFSDNAKVILEKRYLATINGKKETIEEFVKRISMGNDEYENELIRPLNFLPNSPTLFNLGVPGGGTLSACFKFDVADNLNDLDGIMDTVNKAAAVTKFGGGVGYYIGFLRGKDEIVNSTHGKACGPVAVLKFYNQMGVMLTQSGKREAAQMGIMDVDHPDIREFIHMKDEDPQGLRTFNISVAITDAFMDKVLENPDGDEAALLREIAESAWRTGDPGVYFVDAAERDNPTPWVGRLTGTNPCGEVPLLNNEPCNLGSINVANFVSPVGGFAWRKLERVVRLATRYLDDVLDRNHFPDERITAAANHTRKLGLGICGWADALALSGIHYDSREAVTLLRLLMSFIRGIADDESYRLANIKGAAPCFADTGIYKRNATTLCVAPTGTIAILMGASSGIEPHFLLEWDRYMGDGGVLRETIPVMDRLGDFVPHTAMEIDWQWHIKHQAAAQKYVDLAVSKTINLPNDATMEDIEAAYVAMWASGCKGGTVFRDGCRDEQVLVSVATVGQPSLCENCSSDALANNEGCTTCMACGWSVCSV